MTTAVLFDLDGVLIETELQTFRFYQEELQRRYGIHLPDDAFRFKAGRKSVDFWHDALTPEQQKTVDTQALTAYKRERFGAEPDRFIRRVAGGRELLETIRRADLPLALASQNEPRMVNAAVDWLGVRDYFATILTIADIARLKPDPEIYQLAAERLGVPPSACTVIEDSRDGIGAAKNAGMRCIAVRHRYSPAGHLDRADVIVEALADITLPLLRSERGTPRAQKNGPGRKPDPRGY